MAEKARATVEASVQARRSAQQDHQVTALLPTPAPGATAHGGLIPPPMWHGFAPQMPPVP
jgi:hypothetical protein